jgi:hypothetical protein
MVREERRCAGRWHCRSEVQAGVRRDDQAGGIVWRWKDGDNYYVARANALENNVSLYYTQNAPANYDQICRRASPKNQWHTLRVEFAAARIRVALNGTTYIDLDDSHITGAGRAGVWTKADSVTLFDDFVYGPVQAEMKMKARKLTRCAALSGDRATRDRADPSESRFVALFDAFQAAGIRAEPCVWHERFR